VDRGNILKLIEKNLQLNKDLTTAHMGVREIDFFDHSKLYKIMDDLMGVSVIIVADGECHGSSVGWGGTTYL